MYPSRERERVANASAKVCSLTVTPYAFHLCLFGSCAFITLIPKYFLQVLLKVNNSLNGVYMRISTYVVGKSCIFLDETPKKSSTACTGTKRNKPSVNPTYNKLSKLYY